MNEREWTLWISPLPSENPVRKGIVKGSVLKCGYITFQTDQGKFRFRDPDDPSSTHFTADDGSVAILM